MDTFYTFIKKRFIDICLVIVVFGVFIMSGKDPQPDTTIPEPELVDPATTVTQAISPPLPAQTNNIAAPVNNYLIPNKPTSPIPLSTNTQVLPHQGTPKNQAPDLKNTFKMLEGGTVSTEAIIERNTYFKKLSEQMRNLQGQVDSDSSGNKALESDSEPELSEPLDPEDLDNEEEGFDEIYEDLGLIENQAGQ